MKRAAVPLTDGFGSPGGLKRVTVTRFEVVSCVRTVRRSREYVAPESDGPKLDRAIEIGAKHNEGGRRDVEV